MPTSVRLDAKTERVLERLARQRRMTKSAVIREAIHIVADKEERTGSASPYEAVKDLIGCVSGGPPDLSERTGERFREILKRKAARWRSS